MTQRYKSSFGGFMSELVNELNEKWLSLKTLVVDLEVDVLKTLKGNNAAAVRARKGLRQLKNVASELIKVSKVKSDKEPKVKE